MELMSKRGERLNELHMKRDAILGEDLHCNTSANAVICNAFQADAIFMGQYGSETEQRLEKDADWMLEQKHHVEQAHFRWSEVLRLTKDAEEQIAKAVNKWCQLPSIPETNMEKRYYT